MSFLVRMSSGLHRHRERRVEELGLADAPASDQIDRLQVDLLEVQPIRNHQLDAILAAGVDHPLAFVGGDRHRLLAEHVNAGFGGTNRVLGVHRIRQRDVDGIHLFEARVVVVVGKRAADAILLAPASCSFAASSLTSAARRELRLACANAGSTATCAMWPETDDRVTHVSTDRCLGHPPTGVCSALGESGNQSRSL